MHNANNARKLFHLKNFPSLFSIPSSHHLLRQGHTTSAAAPAPRAAYTTAAPRHRRGAATLLVVVVTRAILLVVVTLFIFSRRRRGCVVVVGVAVALRRAAILGAGEVAEQPHRFSLFSSFSLSRSPPSLWYGDTAPPPRVVDCQNEKGRKQKCDPTRVRTADPQLRKLMLYPLSYEALTRNQLLQNAELKQQTTNMHFFAYMNMIIALPYFQRNGVVLFSSFSVQRSFFSPRVSLWRQTYSRTSSVLVSICLWVTLIYL